VVEPVTSPSLNGQRVFVTGAGGQLGRYLVPAIAAASGIPIAVGHHSGDGIDLALDITDPDAVHTAIAGARPDIVIHAAAMTDVDGCETDPNRADAINHTGSRNIAHAANATGAWVLAVGTDFVFSGANPPYTEDASPDPVSVYGSSKLAGERAVLAENPSFAVARTAWVYGGQGKHFPRTVLNVLANRETMAVVEDEIGNPTFAGDLADALVALAAHRPSGIHHLTNSGHTSRFGLAREVARLAGLDPERVMPTTVAEFLAKYPLPAKRPANSTLANTRAASLGVTLRPWQDALAAYIPALTSELTANAT
jgi:dTDP-4-dehydrorhamnose reductase